MELVLRSRRTLVEGRFRPADIVVSGGRIEAILGHGDGRDAQDLGERLLVPGFVDLHSDAVEKEVEPRPGAAFPITSALVELDKKLAMSGITTMFHAVAFNEEALVGQRGNDSAAAIINAITQAGRGQLTVDHKVHARYEITSFSSVSVLLELMRSGKVDILSLMDHSPGQGQFRSLEKWKQYHVPVYKLAEEEVDGIIAHQAHKKARCLDQMKKLAAMARERNILIASHDDDRPDKVDLMAEMGVVLAEFPLNVQTALYAKSRGMGTAMGAPNVVRGQSQSGNISARELISLGCCDCLCSDYHPSSLLQAVFTIYRQMGIGLDKAFAYVTEHPAQMAGLDDRGRIAVGAVADLLVIDPGPIPGVVMTLKGGRPVYSGRDGFPILAKRRQYVHN